MKINWKWLFICIIMTVVSYFLMYIAVAAWMINGGWNYSDHKVFFHLWTIVPSAITFVGLWSEEVIIRR